MDPFRGQRIAKLNLHAAWVGLCEEVRVGENDYWDSVARKLKVGAVDIDLHDIALKREYFKGMRDVLAMPDKGAKAIEKHIEKGQT